jgi:hypothetical protein
MIVLVWATGWATSVQLWMYHSPPPYMVEQASQLRSRDGQRLRARRASSTSPAMPTTIAAGETSATRSCELQLTKLALRWRVTEARTSREGEPPKAPSRGTQLARGKCASRPKGSRAQREWGAAHGCVLVGTPSRLSGFVES